MRHPVIVIGICLSVVIVAVLPVRPCTTFCFLHEGEWIYGRNYDWSIEYGMVCINKRGVAKQAMAEHNPARWISQYGSITFNQYGREMPLGGMNEAGLVIECMWLQHTEYPHVDSRAELNELQWIQYQLDNAATVGEVIASDAEVRIGVGNGYPLHFLICDRAGDAAVVEFLGGAMVAYTGDELPFSALTNNTYAYLKNFSGTVEVDESSVRFNTASHSVKRFYRAARGVTEWDPGAGRDPVEYAFDLLGAVAFQHTMFRIVYDVRNGQIHFATRSNPSIRRIDVSAFDLSCETPVMILDMAAGDGSDVTELFTGYTMDANYELIKASFSGTNFLADIPDSTLRKIAAYPGNLRCEH